MLHELTRLTLSAGLWVSQTPRSRPQVSTGPETPRPHDCPRPGSSARRHVSCWSGSVAASGGRKRLHRSHRQHRRTEGGPQGSQLTAARLDRLAQADLVAQEQTAVRAVQSCFVGSASPTPATADVVFQAAQQRPPIAWGAGRRRRPNPRWLSATDVAPHRGATPPLAVPVAWRPGRAPTGLIMLLYAFLGPVRPACGRPAGAPGYIIVRPPGGG